MGSTGQQDRPQLLSLRSSTAFITFVVAYAVFTDQFLFAVIVPVAPFALHTRMHIEEERVQFWVALLLGVYGIACFVSSGKSSTIHLSEEHPANAAAQLPGDGIRIEARPAVRRGY